MPKQIIQMLKKYNIKNGRCLGLEGTVNLHLKHLSIKIVNPALAKAEFAFRIPYTPGHFFSWLESIL